MSEKTSAEKMPTHSTPKKGCCGGHKSHIKEKHSSEENAPVCTAHSQVARVGSVRESQGSCCCRDHRHT